MGKFLRKGTVNTYGKKKKTKIEVTKVNIINLTNHYNVVNNYFNIVKSPSREETFKKCSKEEIHDLTKFHSSTSASGDEFDKVLKGPIYSVPCRPCTNSSGDEFDRLLDGPTYNPPYNPHIDRKYIWKRQDTINSYSSDASPVKSDLSSVHLFKDGSSNLSGLYSPSHILYSSQHSKTNKWIVTPSTNLKKKNRVFKKKTRKHIQTNKSSNRQLRIQNTMSSTPTHSDSKKWVEPHVSPILPLTSATFDHNQSIVDMFESEELDDEAKQPQPIIGISALVQQFDDLCRIPRNDKNSEDHIDCKEVGNEFKETESSQINTTRNETNNSIQGYTEGSTKYNYNDKLENSKISSNKMPFVLQKNQESDVNDSNYFDHKKDLYRTPTQIYMVLKDKQCADVSENPLSQEVKHPVQKSSIKDVSEGSKFHNSCGQNNESGLEKNLLLCSYNKSFHGFDISDIDKVVVNKPVHKSMSGDIRIVSQDLDNKENNVLVTNSNTTQDPVKEENHSVLSLTPGKQWRRSFLKRKQSELKRSTIGPSLIAKLIKDEACSHVESSSRHSYTFPRFLNKQNDLIQHNAIEDNSFYLSATSSSYLIPSSPEITNKISFRGKGKHMKNHYCDNSNNMEQILEESHLDDQQLLDDSGNNSIGLKFDSWLPNDNKSYLSSNNPRKAEENTANIKSSDHNSKVGDATCLRAEAIVFPDDSEGIDPLIENSSLNETYNIYSNDNCKISMTNDSSIYSKNYMTQTSPSFNETCPLIKMSGLLNTITKRKKPQLERSLCDEEYAFLKELEYSFTKDNVQLFHGTSTDCVLLICHQDSPLPFTEVFSEITLTNSEKIGEGVYGEVFMLSNSDNQRSVLKIIPVEGSRLVNNERQKKFEEVLSEIITTQELSLLRENKEFQTSGFCLLKNLYCLKGEYPPILIKHWQKFNREKKSFNDCPDIFDQQQLYIALELDHAGEPLESFKFSSAKQAYAIYLQIAFSLAVAEMALEFEHRDLHIGNVLLSRTTDEYVDFIHNGELIKLPSYEIKATIIDFTLSRISYKEEVLYFDLATDPELFTAEGDYQFEVYRLMRNDVNNQWNIHAPVTNIRWLYYLADKLIQAKYCCKKSLKLHTQYLKKIKLMKHVVEDFSSSSEFVNSLMKTELHASSIIHKHL